MNAPHITPRGYKVYLVNLQTLGSRAGHGWGKTLEQAQHDALEQARERDPNARLSPSGREVWFSGGINC